MRYDVVLDAYNEYYPHDTTPLSLTGVKEIRLTGCNLNGIHTVARLLSFTADENEEKALPQNEQGMTLVNDHLRPWGGLLFVAHNVPQGERVIFNCELVYS